MINCKLFIITFMIFLQVNLVMAVTPVPSPPEKYHLGDGIFYFDKTEKNSSGSILLITQVYCERHKINFLQLYTSAYPGVDISFISSLRKDYGPCTVIPDDINTDLLISELIDTENEGLADKLSIRVYGHGIYQEDDTSGYYGSWYIYPSVFICVIFILLLLRYKERLRWLWRNFRKSSYDFKTIEGCCNALKDKDEVVRSAAVEALGKMGTDEAVDILIKSLGEDDVWIKKSAILQLGELKSLRAVPYLISALDDKTGFIVSASAHSLALIGSISALEPIKEKVKTIKSSAAVRDLRKVIQKLEKIKKDGC